VIPAGKEETKGERMAHVKKRLMVTIDPSLCLGCRTCELQCALAHSEGGDLMSVIRSGEKPGHRVSVESHEGLPVPLHCQHCEEPACVLACPTGAIGRLADGAPVLVDDARCIGCKMCVQACPFGVITVNTNGKGVLKCDLCIERLAKGLEPACVASCPTKALALREVGETGREKRKKLAAQLVEAGKAAAKES